MASIAHGHHDDRVYHQFEDYEQQTDSYVVGMWCFVVQEIMFFGALFMAYTLYRWQYQTDFYEAHKTLNVMWGAANTTILLTSSFSMAMAVHFAQLKKVKLQQACLAFTMLCAFAFLFIKLYFEWREKFELHHVMGPEYHWTGAGSPGHTQLFFSLYFGMTGLHGVHVLAGIIVIGILMFMTYKNYPSVRDYIPTELVGLYWHFVDIVWIFLFPLFYLMPK